jgi:hypothetical protein
LVILGSDKGFTLPIAGFRLERNSMAKAIKQSNSSTSCSNKAEAEITNLMLLAMQSIIRGPRRGLKPVARRLEVQFASRLAQLSA